VFVALLGLVAAGGCGSGDGDASGASAQKSAAEQSYIREADQVCSKQRAEIRDMRARYQRAVAARGVAEQPMAEGLIKTLAPALGYEVRSVRVLVLPRADVDRVLRILATWQQQIDHAEAHPESFVSASKPFARAERMAREFGFRVCGSL
jgi:hypothetical protein